MPDPLTHVHYLPGPSPDAAPVVCEDCRVTEAETEGHFLAARSEMRHLHFLDSLTAAERETLLTAAMTLGDYLEACVYAYEDAHPELLISYGLLHAALRSLYARTEHAMLACPDDEEEDA